MNQYTIYCTEEQTRKAFELGAPLRIIFDDGSSSNPIYVFNPTTTINGRYGTFEYIIPTTEQMIGWLEKKGITSIEITFSKETKWKFEIFSEYYDFDAPYDSREEATLAAIDAALEYLTSKK